MKKLIPILFILFGWTFIYAYQHRPADIQPVQELPVQTHRVIKVIDGDTIQVSINGQLETVRLIGVDIPEVRPVECYGPEASAEMKRLLEGKQVTLEADPSQGDRDKYGRLLRYVILNGSDIGYQLIRKGYAREYTYNTPYRLQEAFKAAQELAQASNRGLWGAC
jgi:micrococcal nuclease